MPIVYPNIFFGPWGKNIGTYNFADVNNHVRKKDLSHKLQTFMPVNL